MYALQGDKALAQTLESGNFTGYAKRLAHELVLQAIKEDPTLLIGLQAAPHNTSSHAHPTQDDPVSRFVRYRKAQETKRNLDSYLHNVTPRFLVKMIHFLRNHHYEVLLAVSPHDAEERIIYGGTSHAAKLSVWIALKNAGNVFIAESITRNKAEISVVIAATAAEYKTRIGDVERAIDLYESPVDTNAPRKLRMWESF